MTLLLRDGSLKAIFAFVFEGDVKAQQMYVSPLFPSFTLHTSLLT